MRKSIIVIALYVIASVATAAYFIPSVRNLFVVSEHPDIPAFIDSSMDIRKEGSIEKLKSLTEVGFTSFNSKLRLIENRRLYDSIYGGKKFISDEVLGELLKKFNLAYSYVSEFTCDVPDYNLKEIEAFRVKHPLVEKEVEHRGSWIVFSDDGQPQGGIRIDDKTGRIYRTDTNDFLIVAPSTCLKNTIGGYDKDGNALVKDPIVLYKVESGYIIVTSW